ncbi:radical SAM protein [Lachnospiraceae bacterium 54-53]
MESYPRLKNTARLKRLSAFCWAAELLYDYGAVISPAEAFLLAHCTGEFSASELTYIISKVYQWNLEEAGDFLKDTFIKRWACIEWHKEKTCNPQAGYSPRDFLYVPDISLSKDRYETPVEMVLVLTNRCNFRCIYCYNSSGTGKTESELSLPQWLELIDQAADMGIVKCTLTGGEPMLHPHFFEILQALHRHGILAYICTNGSRISAQAVKQFVLLKQPFVQISMDSPHEFVHDRLTVTKNTLPTVKSGIRSLVREGIRVHVKAVILPETMEDSEALIEECYRIGVSQLIIDRYDLCLAGRGDNRFFLTEEQEQTVSEVVEKKKRQIGNAMNISTVFPPRGWKSSEDIVMCGAFYRSFTVLPDGDYPLCEKVAGIPALTVGNFKEMHLKEMWSSPRIREIMQPKRSQVSPICHSCEHLKVCGTGCFAAKQFVTGELYAPDPNCWKACYHENQFLMAQL